jgi:predicted nucleic-acid-binding Zn-ribbon protein
MGEGNIYTGTVEGDALLAQAREEYADFCINCGYCKLYSAIFAKEDAQLIGNKEVVTRTVHPRAVGECRRYPPNIEGTWTHWPEVSLIEGWCGEHAPLSVHDPRVVKDAIRTVK